MRMRMLLSALLCVACVVCQIPVSAIAEELEVTSRQSSIALLLRVNAQSDEDGWTYVEGEQDAPEDGVFEPVTRLEARLDGAEGSVEYRVLSAGDDWPQGADEGWVDGAPSEGDSEQTDSGLRQFVALQMRLQGDAASRLDVVYRVHAQGTWSDWVRNGETAQVQDSSVSGGGDGVDGVDVGESGSVLEGVDGAGADGLSIEGIGIDDVDADDAGMDGVGMDDGTTCVDGVQAYVLAYDDLAQAGESDGATADAIALDDDAIALDDDTVAEVAATGDTTNALDVQLDARQVESGAKQTTANETKSKAASTLVSYEAYMSQGGWTKKVKDGGAAGATGKTSRLEALRIRLGAGIGGGITYRARIQKIGWQDWVKDGTMVGTTGKSLRLEALQMKLTGTAKKSYDVWYRAYVQNVGWQQWVKNGCTTGTVGRSLGIKAVRIALVPKGSAAPTSTVPATGMTANLYSKGPVLQIRGYLQNVGWQSWDGKGGIATAGTNNRGLRLEGLRVRVRGESVSGEVQVSSRVQGLGWQSWAKQGETSGTEGRSLRVEAVKVRLTGNLAKQYDVYYRAYVDDLGWMAWTSNKGVAGTVGLSLRCEAVQMCLVKKGKVPKLPGGNYKGAAVGASATKPPKLSVKLVPQLQHGYKSPKYQRCIVMHDTTEYRSFDYWIDAWIRRGGSGTQFMVKEDGSIRQYADMNQICWHAGGPTLPGLNEKYNVVAYRANAGSAMNQCSIGIEIDHVIDGRGYPKAQLDAIDALIAYIDEYYGYPATILQHKDYHTTNGDCSAEFQGYLRHLQRYRTTR